MYCYPSRDAHCSGHVSHNAPPERNCTCLSGAEVTDSAWQFCWGKKNKHTLLSLILLIMTNSVWPHDDRSPSISIRRERHVISFMSKLKTNPFIYLLSHSPPLHTVNIKLTSVGRHLLPDLRSSLDKSKSVHYNVISCWVEPGSVSVCIVTTPEMWLGSSLVTWSILKMKNWKERKGRL